MTIRQPVFVMVGAGALVGIRLWMIYRARPTRVRLWVCPSCRRRLGLVSWRTSVAVRRVTAKSARAHRTGRRSDLPARPPRGRGLRAGGAAGVRAHHWRFEDMPPQPTVLTAAVAEVTRFTRELQQAEGID